VFQELGVNLRPVDLPDLRLLGAHQPVILVADDEALIRNLVTLLLQHDGYFVLSPADGHEGLELSRKYPGAIDLLITDIDMPRMTGTDLSGHLMEERPGIKVLVMAGADAIEIVSANFSGPSHRPPSILSPGSGMVPVCALLADSLRGESN
jgi:CheY-like chemotaxis protein